MLIDPDGKEIGWWQETLFLLSRPKIAVCIGAAKDGSTDNISSRVSNFSVNLFRAKAEGEPGTKRNAFRHVLWQASITSKWDSRTAELAGNAHEDSNFWGLNVNVNLLKRDFSSSDKEGADTTVDLLNNKIGRAIGEKESHNTMNNLACEVLKAFHEQGLYVVKKRRDGTFHVEKQKISDQEFYEKMEILNNCNNDGLNH